MIEIPGYGDLEAIGRGGFATVYQATQISVGRQVAIKVLSDPSPDADLVRRFERESRAVGALSWHPHIAAVVDAGTTDDGRAFIVFELLTGGSLDDHLERGPLAWTDAVAAMIQVADAVEAAHREDVLHRDIKPANILLNRLGDAKLADFGIASMQDGNKTETGMLATTVAHAAPELFDGAPASASTDIYALGSTLHTLVTARPPFVPTDGAPMATIIKAIATEPPPIPDPTMVPTAVAHVIAHALAKAPAYRPNSALEFGKALQRIQRESGLPVTAMPVGDTISSGFDATIGGPPPVQATTPVGVWAEPSPTPPPATHAPPLWPPPDGPVTSGQVPVGAAGATGAAAGWPAATASGPASAGWSAAAASDRIETAKPFGRTLVVLTVLLVLAAAALGAALAWTRLGGDSVTVTAGGARIVSVKGTEATRLEGFPPEAAIDGATNTSWGIRADAESGRQIIGTTYTIRLEEPVMVTQVGITNGALTELGRVATLTWGRTLDDIRSRASANVTQALPATPGDHLVDFDQVTDRIAFVVSGVHDVEASTAGLAEILIVVDQGSSS